MKPLRIIAIALYVIAAVPLLAGDWLESLSYRIAKNKRGAFVWNLWKFWQYPSPISYLACIVWNVYALMGRRLPDPQWAYLVCMGYRNKKVFTYEED